MIRKEDVFLIGKTHKIHGINGEIQLSFNTDVFEDIEDLFFILEINDILVPFFVKEFRYKNNDTLLVKFEGIETAEEAREYENLNVYLPIEYNEGDEMTNLSAFIGYQVKNGKALIGEITDVDDQTSNWLFFVENGNREFIIPVVEEFIEKIDHKKKMIQMNLPEGMLEIND